MVATAGVKTTGITKDGRFRVHNGSHLVYRNTWDDMTPYEQDWFRNRHPDSVPAPSGNGSVEPSVTPAAAPQNRYADLIERYEFEIASLEEVIKNARENMDLRRRAMTEVSQYREAIDMLNEATLIGEDEEVWFCTDQPEKSVMIPPVIDGVYDRFRHKLRTADGYYHAKSPVDIAVWRRAARASQSHIYEKPIGTFPIMDYGLSQFEGWGSSELYMARQNKRYRSL